MKASEINTEKDNDDNNPKLKLIIISKKGKLDQSGEGRVITLKKDENRMELRMDNMSENITKKKIEKTLQSFMFNKSVTDIKARNRKFVITSNNNKLNTLSERELVYNKNETENNKNNDINVNDDEYSEKIKQKKIEEKLSKLNNSKNENEKNNDIINDVNDDITKFNYNNNSNINNNSNNSKKNLNNNSDCKTSNLDDDNTQKDEIIFVNNNRKNKIKEILRNNDKNEEIKNNDYLIKNTEIKNIKKELIEKEINTEPNDINSRQNKFRELLKRDNMTNDEDDDNEEIEIEECPEEIISHKENNNNNNNNTMNKMSSYSDLESNRAMKNRLSEKDNKYIISSCNDGPNNFNNYFRTNIKINSFNNHNDDNQNKIFNYNDNNNNKETNNINNTNTNNNMNTYNQAEDAIANNNNNNLIGINTPIHFSNGLYSRALTGSKNINKKTTLGSQNSKKVNFNKDSINNNYYNTFSMNKICSICENTFPTSKIYVAECGFHFLCKRCAKNFYEEKIENGDTDFKCPFLKCKAEFPKEIIKNFISEEHYNILNGNLINENVKANKLKPNIYYEKMQLYYKNHVIDINNNKLLYNYNKSKDIFCGRCNKDTLFSKVHNHFLKCLNCGYCECRYCFKDFNEGHMNVNSSNRCKVYYRKTEYYSEMNKFLFFLIQLFLVFSMFFMLFISIFLNIQLFFKNYFRVKKKNINYFFYTFYMMFIIILSTIILLIVSPFIIIWFPFFPSILSLSDY